jgi:hypothetical protein
VHVSFSGLYNEITYIAALITDIQNGIWAVSGCYVDGGDLMFIATVLLDVKVGELTFEGMDVVQLSSSDVPR